jgi:antitoxin ParD1/3/4
MPTRNVVLTDRHDRFIKRMVRAGRFQNASEVLREGLRLVEQREAEDATKLRTLREAARVGFEALDRGDYKEFDSFDALDEYLRKITDKVIAAEK